MLVSTSNETFGFPVNQNAADHLSGQLFFQFQTFNPIIVNPNGGPEHFITALIVKLPRTQKLHLPEMNKLVDYDYYQ